MFALKSRGIYVALELQAARRFRPGDDLPGSKSLPPGGGPAAATDPSLRTKEIEAAEALLEHVNPETGLRLRDDPVLAWVTIAGEISAFDRADPDGPPPPEYEDRLKEMLKRPGVGTGRKGWQVLEASQWKAVADALRKTGLKRPIAGSSHWRREPEFASAQASAGLDLIDDRLYWTPPTFGAPERRSMAWRSGGAISIEAAKKRKGDRPYVVGSWCSRTEGAWALPDEGADLMLVARVAANEDWDGLARRGVFLHPRRWGSGSPGTGGGTDLFVLSEALNANPQVFALLPHAASLCLRSEKAVKKTSSSSWDPSRGRIVIDTPHTQGVAGSPGRKPIATESLTLDVTSPYAVVMASSFGSEPLAQAKRLLVTAVSHAEPTGLLYVDQWKREVAAPGRPPLLVEPVRARVTWKRKGTIRAFALRPDGSRGAEAKVTTSPDGSTLELEGDSATLHWEMVE